MVTYMLLNNPERRRAMLGAFLFYLLVGCAGQPAFDEGRALIEAGDVPAGLARIEEAVRMEPRNRAYRVELLRQRELAVQRNLALAGEAVRTGRFDEAEGALRAALALDPAHARATALQVSLGAARTRAQALAQAAEALEKKDIERAYGTVRGILAADPAHRGALELLRRIEAAGPPVAAASPRLRAAFREPLTLSFRDANLRQIFDLISKNTGLNFLFDRDVRADLKATISVRNTSVEEVVRFLLITHQLDHKVLNDSTVLVYPATQAKRNQYQDLVTKSFYLSNADVKQTAAMVKALVKSKDLFIDEELNLLILRDTPEAVRMVERLLASQDLARPEVVLELEVLEVSNQSLTDLGIRYPDQVSFSLVGAAGTAGTLSLPEWQRRGSELVRISFTNPSLALNFRNQLGRANLLANPKIRVKNRQKARVHIGDKVPVITTTTTATGFASESVTYLDVGLKLDVEPTVVPDGEVGIKVALEVSSIVREIRSTTGTLTYQIGTRVANTHLQVRDGETQVLAGLISDEDRTTANRVPGLGALPIIGRLFGSQSDTVNKTEIVLLMTPRVVRGLARPELRVAEFMSGTADAAGAASLALQTSSAAPARTAATSVAPGGPRPTAAGGVATLTVQAPAQAAEGQPIKVVVGVAGAAGLRSALLDFAFDPNRFSVQGVEDGAASKAAAASVRMSAPEGFGRLTLNVVANSDLAASGELAVITLAPKVARPGNTLLRLEAATLTDAAGRTLPAALPAPSAISLVK